MCWWLRMCFPNLPKHIPHIIRGESTVTWVLTEKWFYTYGVPKRYSDQGKSLKGELLKQLCHLYGIEKSRITPYHPEANGQFKRFNQTLNDLLRTLPQEKKNKRYNTVPQVIYA